MAANSKPTWTRFGDNPPLVNVPVWVKTRRAERARAGRKGFVWLRAVWHWTDGGCKTYCQPNDLWCPAVPPPLPEE